MNNVHGDRVDQFTGRPIDTNRLPVNFGNHPHMGLRNVAAFCEDCDSMKVGPTFMATHGMDPATVDWFAPYVAAIANAAIDAGVASVLLREELWRD